MNSITSFGGVPFGFFDWSDFHLYKDKIIQTCLDRYKPNTVESNIAPYVKTGLWESDFNFLDLEELTNLRTWITLTAKNFVNTLNKTNYHLHIKESWAHVTEHKGHHEPHRHPNSTWSGIFYVQQEDISSGQNIFFNYYTMPEIPGYEFFNEQFSVDIVPGRLVIFPSTILHYAKPYLGTDKRIIISFNSNVI